MRQTWRQLTFLHWPYSADDVRQLLPAGLELDTFDAQAWVGLIPFTIHHLTGFRPFPETNVRTYVIGPDGGRGVWFFSLDAARLLAVIGARVGYGLSYYWSTMRVAMEGRRIRYQSRRKWPHHRAPTNILVEPGNLYTAAELGPRDHFLTARYCLYTIRRGRVVRAQIEHDPWPLARARVVEANDTLIQAAGLRPPAGAALAHYSADIDVKIGYPRACG